MVKLYHYHARKNYSVLKRFHISENTKKYYAWENTIMKTLRVNDTEILMTLSTLGREKRWTYYATAPKRTQSFR